MLLNVTRKDIQRGVRGAARRCPIAQALMRTMPLEDIRVLPYRVMVKRVGEEWTGAFLSRRTQRAIERFDKKKGMKPFTTRIPFLFLDSMS